MQRAILESDERFCLAAILLSFDFKNQSRGLAGSLRAMSDSAWRRFCCRSISRIRVELLPVPAKRDGASCCFSPDAAVHHRAQ
ncbi:unnamed protein product [Linum trigynum]|uniref:Uncharacterized protein n=1 Tax=Linum trigynum TaxID=586398 RepID=A0AAV2ER22_9ROSI